MRSRIRIICVVILLSALAIPAVCADKKKGKPLSAAEVFKRSVPAIVAIDCLGQNNARIGTASGFVVSDNGKIVTNLHVIQPCSGVVVRLSNGDVYDSASVIDIDVRRDIALIRIKAASLPVLPLGDSNGIEVGETVFSIGNPSGLQNTLQQGLVSGFREMQGYRLIQVSASINPGNSGGPILDNQGQVIAIAAMKIVGAENLGFAIPVNYAKGYLDTKTEVPFLTFAATMKAAQAATNPAPAGKAAGGVAGGIPGGIPGGIVGGIPSNSIGTGGGIGAGGNAGIGGTGGVFNAGNGVSAPTVLTRVEPAYSEEARKAKLSGTVLLSLVVDETGKPRDLKVVRPLGMGLDQKAVEAVQKWTFKPGMKDGKAVAVVASIQVNFRLLDNPPADAGSSSNPASSGAPSSNTPSSATPASATPASGTPSFSTIETIAGRDWRFNGNGIPARQAALGHVYGVTYDRAGNVYATDMGNHAVVKIDPEERLSTLAGPDSAPQNRPFFPFGVAVDSSGAVYFTENGQRVRKILANGEVTLIAGSDKRGFSPDGSVAAGSALSNVHGIVIAADGSIIFSEWGNNRVRRVDAQGRLQTVAGDGQGRFAGDGGPATQASLLHPSGLALDSAGNLYVADQNNGRVRKIGADGRINTIAGSGVTRIAPGCPTGVAVNGRGDVFVADPCKRQLLLVRNGEASVLAGTGTGVKEPSGDGGPAAAASFDEWSLAVNEKDDLLVSGPDYGRIYRIRQDGTFSTLAGAGDWRAPQDGMLARNTSFQRPARMAVDAAGAVFMADFDANRIYRIDQRGVVTKIGGVARGYYSGENVDARDSGINHPFSVRLRPNGSVIFSERGSNRIREITSDGKLRTLAGNGRAEYAGDGGRAPAAALNNPAGICMDASGNIYIADTNNNRVRKITPDGQIQLVAGNGTRGYGGDGGPAERAALNTPMAVEAGPDGSLYIADSGNHRVRKIADGIITTVAGDGADRFAGDGGPAVKSGLNWPYDLAFGPDRALYILDSTQSRIRRVDAATGTITTVAGSGARNISGDGGSPLQAGLGQPEGLAADSSGNLYVAAQSGRIRVIRTSASGRGGAVSSGVGAPRQPVEQPVTPPPAAAIQVSEDRMETFLRGKIGVWNADDAKTVLGAVKDQTQQQSGMSLTFDTPGTNFSRVVLAVGASGKLETVNFYPSQRMSWERQLAYMKGKFPEDAFKADQSGDSTLYTFTRSRTSFLVRPDGTISAMTIF